MFIDIIMWVLIGIITLFAFIGFYTFFSMIFDENEQETDENGA